VKAHKLSRHHHQFASVMVLITQFPPEVRNRIYELALNVSIADVVRKSVKQRQVMGATALSSDTSSHNEGSEPSQTLSHHALAATPNVLMGVRGAPPHPIPFFEELTLAPSVVTTNGENVREPVRLPPQPALTMVSKEIRKETLPLYYLSLLGRDAVYTIDVNNQSNCFTQWLQTALSVYKSAGEAAKLTLVLRNTNHVAVIRIHYSVADGSQEMGIYHFHLPNYMILDNLYNDTDAWLDSCQTMRKPDFSTTRILRGLAIKRLYSSYISDLDESGNSIVRVLRLIVAELRYGHRADWSRWYSVVIERIEQEHNKACRTSFEALEKEQIRTSGQV